MHVTFLAGVKTERFFKLTRSDLSCFVIDTLWSKDILLFSSAPTVPKLKI